VSSVDPAASMVTTPITNGNLTTRHSGALNRQKNSVIRNQVTHHGSCNCKSSFCPSAKYRNNVNAVSTIRYGTTTARTSPLACRGLAVKCREKYPDSVTKIGMCTV